MWRWLSSMLHPRCGWLALALLLATVVCLPLSLVESRWLIGASALVGVSLLAAWLGLYAGQAPLPGWIVALLGLLSGIEWNAAVIGRLLPSAEAMWREAGHALHWLAAGLRGQWTADLPLLPLLPDLWARLSALLARLGAWSQAGMAGTVSRDSLVLLLFAAIATWWISYFAGWQLARGRSALGAFLPLGCAVLANVALTHGTGIVYLRTFLGGALLLMVFSRYDHLQKGWEREGIDYSPDLQSAVRLVGLGLTTALLLLSLLVPFVTWQQTVDTFWRYAYEPWTEVTQRLDRLFAGRNPVPPQPSERGGRGADAHSLGGAVSTTDDLVFYVHTSDPPPQPPEARMPYDQPVEPPKHYWRTVTYDTYTGRGWENGDVQRSEQRPMAPLAEPLYPHTILTQTYELRLPGSGLVPAANEPLQADKPCTLVQRDEGDMVGFAVNVQSYTVVSGIPAPTITQLREAGADYPPEVISGYLALPDIPRRVRDLALELTAQAEAPYDKVLAVERHLRDYDYDLKIAEPPPGQDVADYLLFSTRRGYCDYYATAMVVMLRVAGVPARYASGYATGHYDYQRQAYAVTQGAAHAWVEIYFPGYGWIEFEPTPYRTVFTRPVGGTMPAPAVVTLPPHGAPWGARTTSVLLVMVVALLGLGGVFLLTLLTLRGRKGFSSARLTVQLYARMLRWAERVHLGPARGDTPLEFSTRLGRAVETRGPWAEGAAAESDLIGRAYVRARFGTAADFSARDAGQALTAWEKLRGKLRWLFIWRR